MKITKSRLYPPRNPLTGKLIARIEPMFPAGYAGSTMAWNDDQSIDTVNIYTPDFKDSKMVVIRQTTTADEVAQMERDFVEWLKS